MKHENTRDQPPSPGTCAHQGLEFWHLRYLVAVADAGTFTRAAERLFIAQPTLSQQIRRLEELVGTPLLHSRRDGVQLTAAGHVLLEESRAVLSRLEQGVGRSRQAAGLERPRLRFVLQPDLPECLAVATAQRLWLVAAAAGAEVSWVEAPLDGEFTLIASRRRGAGLADPGAGSAGGPAGGDEPGGVRAGGVGPGRHSAGPAPADGPEEFIGMEVVHGPRRASPATYDAWLAELRAVRPQFAFADPPFRHSLPMTLTFTARPAIRPRC